MRMRWLGERAELFDGEVVAGMGEDVLEVGKGLGCFGIE